MSDERSAACSGKRTFLTFALAAKQAEHLRRHKEMAGAAYHCPHCNGFHVGSPAVRQKKRRPQADD